MARAPSVGARIQAQIKEAVKDALVERTLADHEKRVSELEKFRWWLLTGVAVGSVSSVASFVSQAVNNQWTHH